MSARRLGKYLLRERLGAGGMAEVFRAEVVGAAGFRRQVALKMIRPEWAEDPDFVRMFTDEARLSATLAHPNVVQTLDFGHEAGRWYLAMELCDGVSLGTALRWLQGRGERLDPALGAKVVAEVAAALDHAYRARGPDGRPLELVHRDVNPANVLLTRHGEVKLGDFGIAKAAGRASMTEAGSLKGKIPYMAPEQAWGRAIDARSDVYALGLLLHEVAAGRRAVEADSEIAALEEARAARRGPLPPGVAPALAAVIERACALAPEDRFAGAGALREALLPLAAAPGRDLAAEVAALVRAVQPRPSGPMELVADTLASLPLADGEAGTDPGGAPGGGTEVGTRRGVPDSDRRGGPGTAPGTEAAVRAPRSLTAAPAAEEGPTGRLDLDDETPAPRRAGRTRIAGAVAAAVAVVGGLAGALLLARGTGASTEPGAAAVPPGIPAPSPLTAAAPSPAPAPASLVVAPDTQAPTDPRAAPMPVPRAQRVVAGDGGPARLPGDPGSLPVTARPGAAAASGGSRAKPSSRVGARSGRASVAPAPAVAPAPSAAGSGERATLRIQVEPWGDVLLDGRPLGQTPLGPVEVAPGAHTVVARHPSLGERTARVSVSPGEARPVRLRFEGAP